MPADTTIFEPYFNTTEKKLIYAAAEEAAEYLKDFYRISPREWFNHCYDVRTEGEDTSSRPQRNALAEVRQYKPFLRTSSIFPQDRYHIFLFDRNILQTLWQKSELEFYPFMLYILTHELIHIVRFCQNMHPFECDPVALQKEEERVERLTHQVLQERQKKDLWHNQPEL